MLKILATLLLATTFNTFACEEGALEADITGMVYALDYSHPGAGSIEHYTYQTVSVLSFLHSYYVTIKKCRV